MAFRPNIRGPLCPTGEIIVAAAGTAIPLSINWSPDYNPETPTTQGGSVPEYAISFEDIIISPKTNNQGGVFIVIYDINGATGSKNTTSSIVIYIPKGNAPVSLKHYLGSSKLNPNSLAVDTDQDGDGIYACGLVA
jgi:hypothetical protein